MRLPPTNRQPTLENTTHFPTLPEKKKNEKKKPKNNSLLFSFVYGLFFAAKQTRPYISL